MSVAGPLAREREERQENEVKGREKEKEEEEKIGKEAEEDPLGRLTRCYRGVCRALLLVRKTT